MPPCRRWLALALTVSLVYGVLGPWGRSAAARPAPEVLRAYDLAYNLDHEEAIATLQQVIAERPNDPAGYRGVAALTWLRMLFLRGAVLVDAQMTSRVKSAGDTPEPPADMADVFHTHIDRAISLSQQAVDKAKDDPDAHYQLGASVALLASYKASIEGDGLKALRDAKRAYQAHQRVLELDPSRKDANLTLGIYRYLVSLLPRPARMMAYLVGFDGGREEAVQLVEAAAAYPGETEAEAKFALVLLYNREKQFNKAQRVLYDLKRQYPRNRLVWLEAGSTWLRDERAHMADRDLALGFQKLRTDTRTRMHGEDEIWMLKRGAARVSLRRLDEARRDLAVAQTSSDKAWVRGRAHVELGKIADLEGKRELARKEYDRGRKLCKSANDRRCARAAETLKKRGYPIDE
jgi:tetratricopeptide (TPR) repeat protein